ncbi:MAG: hypothetical protein AABX35_00955 [Nanoarchaeota archaeon]
MDWLNLIGLILNFLGSALLVWDALISYTKSKSYVQIEYPDDYVRRKVHRYNAEYKPVKITKEEILLIVSLFLVSIGFLLQIIALWV